MDLVSPRAVPILAPAVGACPGVSPLPPHCGVRVPQILLFPSEMGKKVLRVLVGGAQGAANPGVRWDAEPFPP